MEMNLYQSHLRLRFIKFNRENITKVKNVIRKAMNEYKEKKTRISVDVDPVSML